MAFMKDTQLIIKETVGLTPKEISEKSIDEIKMYTKKARKKNIKFRNIFNFIFHNKEEQKISEILPRGSMIAANNRFFYKKEINKKIKKMR